MSPFGIILYYTDSHPAGGEPFFTESELIENAQDIAVNQEDDDIIETAEEAMTYLENQGYGTFHETIQYFDRNDITFVDKAEINKPLTLLPYVKLDESERNTNLQSFLKTYDDPQTFAKAFIEEEVKDLEGVYDCFINHLNLTTDTQDRPLKLTVDFGVTEPTNQDLIDCQKFANLLKEEGLL